MNVDFVMFLSKLPNWLSMVITIFGSCGISISSVFLWENRRKPNNTKPKTPIVIIMISVLLLVIVCGGIWADSVLVEVPDVYGMTYHSAVTTLERQGLKYEVVVGAKDPNADTVNFMSETPGTYILKPTKLVLNLKIANTMSVPIANDTSEKGHSILVETPNQTNTSNIKPLKSNIPIAKYLEPDVSAILSDSNLTVKVDSNRNTFNNIDPDEVFSWGIHLFSSIEGGNPGDMFIELEISIDSDYNVKSSRILVYGIKDDGYYREKELNNRITTIFDGQYFIIDCNISNEYINLEDICIQAIAYSS